MAEERVQRRLAAILAADVVGYSRLMEADEAGTHHRGVTSCHHTTLRARSGPLDTGSRSAPDREREHAHWNPDRETLMLATAGATEMLGTFPTA